VASEHEVVYEAVRDGLDGVPGLGENAPRGLKFANDWLEGLITEGDRTWEILRGMGR
jgi:hypothetical protein